MWVVEMFLSNFMEHNFWVKRPDCWLPIFKFRDFVPKLFYSWMQIHYTQIHTYFDWNHKSFCCCYFNMNFFSCIFLTCSGELIMKPLLCLLRNNQTIWIPVKFRIRCFWCFISWDLLPEFGDKSLWLFHNSAHLVSRDYPLLPHTH